MLQVRNDLLGTPNNKTTVFSGKQGIEISFEGRGRRTFMGPTYAPRLVEVQSWVV